MAERFDAVVVGSGFGASAAACRLAQAGRSVLVLERGRSYPPGSFPRSPRGRGAEPLGPAPVALRHVRRVGVPRHRGASCPAGSAAARSSTPTCCCARTRPGSSTTLPGSPERPWPVTYDDLEPHYEAAEAMLGAQRYPFDVRPVLLDRQDRGPALRRLPTRPRLAAAAPGRDLRQPRPAAGPRRAHRRGATPTSTACPAEPAGCAASATSAATTAPRTPSTTTTSRVPSTPAPRSAPCPRCTASSPTEPAATGSRYVRHDPDGAPGAAGETVARWSADRLIFGAGTFGSTYLLLRNRGAFPHLSPALGTRFSGNGDLLTFLHHSRRRVRGRRGAPAPRPRVRPGHHQRHPDARHPRRRRRPWDGGSTSRTVGTRSSWTGSPRARAPRWSRPGWREFLARRVWAHATGRPRSNISADISGLLGGGVTSATMLPVLLHGPGHP